MHLLAFALILSHWLAIGLDPTQLLVPGDIFPIPITIAARGLRQERHVPSWRRRGQRFHVIIRDVIW